MMSPWEPERVPSNRCLSGLSWPARCGGGCYLVLRPQLGPAALLENDWVFSASKIAWQLKLAWRSWAWCLSVAPAARCCVLNMLDIPPCAKAWFSIGEYLLIFGASLYLCGLHLHIGYTQTGGFRALGSLHCVLSVVLDVWTLPLCAPCLTPLPPPGSERRLRLFLVPPLALPGSAL